MSSVEAVYQAKLIKKLKQLFPGCFVLKNDSGYMPGIPDLLILYGEQWAMLEVKAAENSPERPNQRHYVETLDDMSFADFIYPENEAEVLRELEFAFGTRRPPRLSRS